MVRGSGKFKQKRGGGRSFSKHLTLDENGTAVSTDKWATRGKREDDEEDEDEESSEESSEEEEEEEEGEPDPTKATSSTQPELSRSDRKAAKKAQQKAKEGDAEDEDADLVNPNHETAKTKKIGDLGAPVQLSRREREQKEKQEAKERYWKLHLAGKTDQAKSDLSRLAAIRKEREEAAAKRKAELDAKQAEIDARVQAQKEKKRA